MQIRTRLTIQFILIVAGILFSSLYFVYDRFKKAVEDEFYISLRSKALMTAEMVLKDEGKIKVIENEPVGNDSNLPFKDNIIIYNSAFKKVFAFDRWSQSLTLEELEQVKRKESRFDKSGLYVIGVHYQNQTGRTYYVVAESMFEFEELKNLKYILIFTFFMGVILVAAGGWFYTGQAVAPINKVISDIEKILPTRLNARLKTNNEKDEIGKLVSTFNGMLDRIQGAFGMQRSFVSNVSHELKNPISVILSQLEVTLSNPERSATEYRETLVSVLHDTKGMSTVVNDLLQLGRLLADESGKVPLDQVHLDEVILSARSGLLKTGKGYTIQFQIAGEMESELAFMVNGNESLLRSAISNLMDNCCKYSHDRRVEVTLSVNEQGNNVLELKDRGQGISPEALQHVFRPFYREPGINHISGYGIGLSLVDAILKLHQIELNVHSVQGEGTTFILTFPKQLTSIQK